MGEPICPPMGRTAVKELVYHRQLLPSLERFHDRMLIIDGEHRSTHGEHGERVFRLAHSLKHELGVERGDRFAVMSLNGHQYLEQYHAAFLGAGIINPLNLRLAPAELEYILYDSGAKVVFTDAWFGNVIDQVRAAAGVEQVVLVGDGDVPHDVKYEDLVAAGAAVTPDEPEEDDPVVLMYTGGTTGLPKGVLLDQRAEMLNLYHALMQWQFDDTDVFLHQTPMFHAASMGGVLGIPGAGAVSTFVPVFNPEQVLDVIARDGVTSTVMVPTMIGMLLQHPSFRAEKLATLRTLTYGASPMPVALLEQLLALYPTLDIYQGYGMTESSALLTSLGPREHREGGVLLRSAGRALKGVTVTIQDEDGTVLPTGATGEVCARGGMFMREYWHKPEATAEAFRGGWYHTGDAGYLDEHGYLFLVDRVKDMIVTGGENVYSVEVENAIATYPGVAQVAVIGIPSPQWGEAVHAIVVPQEGVTLTEADIIEHARQKIAGYKVPKSVEFRTEPLPLSGAMKILKRDLRKPYWEGHDRGVG
jgi:long-chain acyl-CoA synthetase